MVRKNNTTKNNNPWAEFDRWAEKADIEVVTPDKIIGCPPEENKLIIVKSTKALLGKVIKFPDKKNGKDYR